MHGENKYDIFKTFSRRKTAFEIQAYVEKQYFSGCRKIYMSQDGIIGRAST